MLIKGKRNAIEKAILDYVGILGWARAAPRFVRTTGSNAVLTVNRTETNNIRAALALAADTISVLRVSATIKGLQKKQ